MEFVLLALAVLIGITLGAVGGGGSILAVPVLVGVGGMAVTDATTASLLVVGTSALIGLGFELRPGRRDASRTRVHIATGLMFGLSGVGGAWVGTSINRQLADGPLLLGFAALMVVVTARMAFSLRSGTGRPAPAACGEAPVAGATDTAVATPAAAQSPTGAAPVAAAAGGRFRPRRSERGSAALPAPGLERPTTGGARARDCRDVAGIDTCSVVRLIAAGTAVGFLTGLFGVGGGFVIVPALVLVLRMPINEAAATSLLVIALNSAVALAMRASGGSVHLAELDWSVVAPFTALTAAGALVGRAIANRLPARTLSVALTVLIGVVAVWMATKGIALL